MAKKLFEVTVETLLFVLAEDEADAEDEARHNMHEEEPVVRVREVKSANWPVDNNYRSGWPWGGDCDKTVGELLEEMRAPKPASPPERPQGGDVSLRDRAWPLGERLFWAKVCPFLALGQLGFGLGWLWRFADTGDGIWTALAYFVASDVLLIIGVACRTTHPKGET